MRCIAGVAMFDVTIVGGGLAGASLAVALRDRSPGRVALVEARTGSGLQRDVFDERSIALADVSRRIFDTMGIWGALKSDAHPIHEIHVSEKGVFGKTRIRAADEGMDALAWTVPHRLLGNALHGGLAGVELISPATVTHIAQHTDHMVAVLNGARGEIKTRLLVLADAGSELRSLAGFEVDDSDYQQVAVVANIETETAMDHVAYERFTPHGPMAVLPLGGVRHGVVWTCGQEAANAVSEWPDARFIRELQADFGYRLGKILNVGKRLVFPLRLVRASRMVKGRVVVIGNAAHTLHPVAGQSFNLTLRDIALLAQKVFDSGDAGDADMLASWQNQRRADVNRVVGFTDFLARAFTRRWNMLAPLRGAMLMGFALLPPLRRAVIRRSLGLLPPASRLASGLPLTSGRQARGC